MHVGSLYAVAAAAGSGTIAVLLALNVDVLLAGVIGVAITFGVRVASVLFGWSLPEQRAITRLPKLPSLPRRTRSDADAQSEVERGRTVTTATGVIHLHPTTSSIPVVGSEPRTRRRSPIPGASHSRS